MVANPNDSIEQLRGSWPGVLSLSAIHLLAFGMLYLVLAQITYAFDDHYKLIGFVVTERFSAILWLSNYVAAYTWIVLLVIAVDLIMVYRLFHNGIRWASAYSHGVLLSMGCAAFLAISWLITPMVWSRPAPGKPSVANVEIAADNEAVRIAANLTQ